MAIMSFGSHRAWASSLVLLLVIIGLSQGANYKVAVILPTTGSTSSAMYAAASSAAQQAGIDVSAQWSADSFPHTFQVVTYDSENLGSETMAHGITSMQDTEVMAVVGAGPDDLTLPLTQLLKTSNMAVLSPYSRFVVPAELDNFYGLGASVQHQAKIMEAFMLKYGWNKISISYTGEDESIALKDALIALPGMELNHDPILLPASATNYLKLYDPAINASSNIYVIIVPNKDTLTNVISQTQVSGGFWVGPKAFFFFNSDPTMWRIINQGGLMLRETNGSPANVTDFAAKIGGTPQNGAAAAYDAVTAIAAAIRRLGTVNRANIRAELANTDQNGYSGPLTFGSNGFREVKTYNVSNVYSTAPPTNRPNRVVFDWDGELNPTAVNPLWPGSAQSPTTGNVTLWPVAFISAMFTNYAEMLEAGVVVPMNRTSTASFVRFAVSRVNAQLPVDTKISTPPLTDNGTVSGAVRIGSTLSSDNYIATVATFGSANTKILQGILSAYNIPQFAYYAGDPTLSDKSAYPTLIRMFPSDTKQIDAIISLIEYFKWELVGALSSTSDFGAVSDATFTSVLRGHESIEHGKSAVFLENFSDLEAQLQTLKDARINILVLFADPVAYPRVLQAMRSIDYQPRAVIVPERFFTPLLWEHYLNNTGLTLGDFRGWIGAAPAGGFDNPNFVQLAADVNAASPQAYSQMKEGFAQSPDYCAFIYDSFYVLGQAIQTCLSEGKNPAVYADLMDCVSRMDLEGTTGRIAFNSNQDRVENRFVAKYMTNDGNGEVFGTWDDTNGGRNLAITSSVVWPDGTTNVPLAVDPKKVKWLMWSSPAGIVLAVIAGIGLLYVAGMVVLMILWHESPLLISSTYPFLVLILVGAGLGFGSMYTWIGEPREWICALRIWLPPMAFILMLAPLLAKTWRLHRIFSLATLKRTPIPLWKLIVMVVCVALIQVAICIAWISAGTIKVVTIDDKQNATEAYRICEQNRTTRICAYVTFGYLGLLMLIGAYYAFRVRNLPKDFNESRWIGFSIYNTLLFSIIIVILGYSLVDFKVTVLILICVCTLAITLGVVTLMMAPKIWDLILHPDRRSSSGNSGSTHTPRGSRRSYNGNSSFRQEPSSGSSPRRRHDYSRRPSHANTSEMRTMSKSGSRNSDGGSGTARSTTNGKGKGKRKSQNKPTADQTPTPPPQQPMNADPTSSSSESSDDSSRE